MKLEMGVFGGKVIPGPVSLEYVKALENVGADPVWVKALKEEHIPKLNFWQTLLLYLKLD